MTKGKRAKPFRVQFPPLDFIPRICVIGHSMPKRLFRAFDCESRKDGLNGEILAGNMSKGQAYARYLHVSSIVRDIKFFHSPLVCDKKFDEAVQRAGAENPDLIIFHASSNDLAAKNCDVKQVFKRLRDRANDLILNYNVSAVMFASVLKREDIPVNGKGRLACSIKEFRSRAKMMNRLLKREARLSYDFCYVLLPRFWYDVGPREVEVSEWSEDRLHPGPEINSEGFARYYHAFRHVILTGVPFLAQARFMATFQ